MLHEGDHFGSRELRDLVAQSASSHRDRLSGRVMSARFAIAMMVTVAFAALPSIGQASDAKPAAFVRLRNNA